MGLTYATFHKEKKKKKKSTAVEVFDLVMETARLAPFVCGFKIEHSSIEVTY